MNEMAKRGARRLEERAIASLSPADVLLSAKP